MSAARYYKDEWRRRLLAGEELPIWLRRNPRYAYIEQACFAAVFWRDQEKIKALYDEARRLTKLTGFRWVVDHVIPLKHPDVCGLSVDYNMQVVPYAVNASKGNKWHPDQTSFDFMCEEIHGQSAYSNPAR